MPLLALSNELLDKIFEHCDLKSVKCGRLTNGRLREVGNRHLLRELPLYYNQESLDRLDALSTTHQDMAKGIQAVWIQIDRLKSMDKETWEVKRQEQYDEHSILRDDWAEELKSRGQPYKNPRTGSIPIIDPNSRRSKHAEISSHYLDRGYREYNALYTNQRRLDQAGFLREKCAALFRVCPQLSSIWINSGGAVRRCTTQQSASFRQGLVPPCNLYTRDYDANVRVASQVLLGALHAGTKLESLVLGGVNYRFLTQASPQMSKLAQVLQHVQHLHWDVGETFVTPRDGDGIEIIDGHEVHMGPIIDDAEFNQMHMIFDHGLFSQFIGPHATNLQTLVISMPELGSTQLRPVQFVHVVGGLHFPRLRTFSLKRVQTTLVGLETFLMRHKEVLVELRLCDLYLRQSTTDIDGRERWQDFFLAVGGKLPHLQSVCLRGGWHNLRGEISYAFGHGLSEYVGTPLSETTEAFMLRGGAKLPCACDKCFKGHGSSLEGNRTELLRWCGEAIVPEIRPIGWDLSWEK